MDLPQLHAQGDNSCSVQNLTIPSSAPNTVSPRYLNSSSRLRDVLTHTAKLAHSDSKSSGAGIDIMSPWGFSLHVGLIAKEWWKHSSFLFT